MDGPDPIPGVFTISHPDATRATLEFGSADSGTPVVILPPAGNVGEQKWELHVLSNGNVTLKNLKSETYLSYHGEPKLKKLVGGFEDPREWLLYKTAEPLVFHVAVPGGPVGGGHELALDASILDSYPPRTALMPLNVYDMGQAWRFTFVRRH